MGGLSQENVISGLIPVSQWKAGVISVAVHIVKLNAIKAFLRAQVYAGLHDRPEDIDLADIQIPLAGPAIAVALHRGGELTGVRPPILPGAGVNLTDGSVPLRVE